jgi:hypothetical protein
MQEHVDVHKMLPVKARWDDTVWKGPIDFISAQAGGMGESQPAHGPHKVETETPRAGGDASSNGKQRRKHTNEVREVGLAVI